MTSRGVCGVNVCCPFINGLFTLDKPSYLIKKLLPIQQLVSLTSVLDCLFCFSQLLDFSWCVLYKILDDAKIFSDFISNLDSVLDDFPYNGYHLSITKSPHKIHSCYSKHHFCGSWNFRYWFIWSQLILSKFSIDQLLEATSTQFSAFIHWYFWIMHLGKQVVFCVLLLSLLVFFFNSEQPHQYCRTLDHNCCNDPPSSGLDDLCNASYLLFIMKGRLRMLQKWELTHLKAWGMSWLIKENINILLIEVPSLTVKSTLPHGSNLVRYIMLVHSLLKKWKKSRHSYNCYFWWWPCSDTICMLPEMGLWWAEIIQFYIYSCLSLAVWGLLVVNPAFVSSFVVVIHIPTSWFVPKIYRFTPIMLKGIGTGLLMLDLQDLIYIALTCLPTVQDKSPMYSLISAFNAFEYCLNSRAKLFITGKKYPSNLHLPVDNTFLWLIFPQVFNGLAQLLINMTILEFLRTHVPRSMQGLLIVSGIPC